jgi:hypothetical protein
MTNLTHEEIFAAIRYLDPDLRVIAGSETRDSALLVCVGLLLLFSILAFALLFLSIS